MNTFRSARTFLQAVEARYQALTSYSDTGWTTRIHRLHERRCTFETSYVAPDQFRFAFETPHPYWRLRHRVARHVFGSADGALYDYDRSYSGAESLETPESLELAVAGATGISDGTAHTIASLLFPDVRGFRLSDLQRLRFRRTRVIDGVACIAISGLHPRAGRYTAWFGAQDLMLRRLLRPRLQCDERRTNIRVNEMIPVETFAVPRIGA